MSSSAVYVLLSEEAASRLQRDPKANQHMADHGEPDSDAQPRGIEAPSTVALETWEVVGAEGDARAPSWYDDEAAAGPLFWAVAGKQLWVTDGDVFHYRMPYYTPPADVPAVAAALDRISGAAIAARTRLLADQGIISGQWNQEIAGHVHNLQILHRDAAKSGLGVLCTFL